VHSRIDFDFLTAQGVATYRAFMEDAAELVCSKYGGSLSGEHGDGHARAELLDRMFGPELLEAFREFKAIFDPDGKLNPGKVVDPYPLDTHLRTGPDYGSRPVRTTFRFPDDGGSFAAAAERCFGVGACRDQSGVMCPSYQVTLEEQHSTRGRARLLFEMMRSDVLERGWREEAVKESLDLCLACKGCKHECPVRVDMATYKAEFLSHYYRRRARPRQAYALGLIPWTARVASRAPRVANALTQRAPFAGLAKRVAGIAPERAAPRFAPRTFRDWFAARPPRAASGRPRVLLWPDTFTNFFEPEVAIAAVEVLEASGRHVVVPSLILCCGRPLYDYGMLTLAKRQLQQVLRALRDELRAGTPVVALEPSCGAVFRDELRSLLPDDEDAKRLNRLTCSLAEYLVRHAHDRRLGGLAQRALVHLHCHQRATSDTSCDERILSELGLAFGVLDPGCCGLAGSFGYEAGERYEVSMKAGERVLLPAVRAAAPDTLIISDGFSCRSQIKHGTHRTALHLAQVAQLALRGDQTAPHAYPERGLIAARDAA
jgi:Fe-S oxidoreductase